MPKGKAKKVEETTESVEITEEEVKKAVSKAAKKKTSNVEDKKARIKSLNKKIKSLQSEFNETNLEVEMERFKELTCVNCEAPLDLTDEQISEFMVKGSTSKIIQCPNCQMLNRIDVVYIEEPHEGTAQISQEEKGYAYLEKPISALDKEQLLKRLSIETELIENGSSRRTPETQMILRLIKILFE